VIAVCGEAIVDLVPVGETAYEAKPGGSPANTAVALARLGCPVTMLARLSVDGFGVLLREHLARNGVDLTHAIRAGEPSSLAIVDPGVNGDVAYRFVIDGTVDWQWTDDELSALPSHVVAVHTGSLALAQATAIERFLHRLRGEVTISIDPNLRSPVMPPVDQARQAVARWLRLADVFKASAADVELLHPGADPTDVARDWSTAGPAIVVVTAGADGVVAVVGDEVVRLAAVPTEVVDTIGAGDTFTAGLLDGLHRAGHLGGRLGALTASDLRPALDRALRAAAVTCNRVGADPPYAAEIA
jgi:fructokinase